MEWLRRYRFLMLVYGLALWAGWHEYRERRAQRPPDEPAEVVLNLYPTGSEIQYIIGRGFEKQGAEEQRRGHKPESRAALENARLHFENALATGVKTDENLFYHHALTLVLLKADAADIDNAIAAWRYNFPDSTKVDPRDPSAVLFALGDAEQRAGRY